MLLLRLPLRILLILLLVVFFFCRVCHHRSDCLSSSPRRQVILVGGVGIAVVGFFVARSFALVLLTIDVRPHSCCALCIVVAVSWSADASLYLLRAPSMNGPSDGEVIETLLDNVSKNEAALASRQTLL